MRTRLLVLSLLMLTAMPLAAGQGAPEPTVTVTTDAETVVVSRETSASAQFTVTFESDNPFDTVQPREVRVEASELPAGWSVQVDPQRLQLSAGESGTVTVTFTLGASAEQSEVPMTLTARLVPRGAEGTPIGSQVDPEAEGSADVTLQREDPLTREVLEGLGSWIFIILGVVAILVVALVVVLARNNRNVVALASSVKEATVAPGRSVAVPVRVENLTNDESTVVFHVAPMPAGWAASLPVPELALDGRRTEELHLVVTSPKDAAPGASARVGMSAHSAQNPRRVAEHVVDVVVGDTEARHAAGDTTPADEQKE